MSNSTRADDDRVLAMLDGRYRGLSAGQMARAMKTTRSGVLGLIKRVQDDDLRLSGEPEDVVREAYAARLTGGPGRKGKGKWG